jgi:hypothetical protein
MEEMRSAAPSAAQVTRMVNVAQSVMITRGLDMQELKLSLRNRRWPGGRQCIESLHSVRGRMHSGLERDGVQVAQLSPA